MKSLSAARFARSDPNERRAALTDASEVVHPKVVKAMARALDDRDAGVSTHTVVLLGTMDLPESVSALRKHGTAREEGPRPGPRTPRRRAALHRDARGSGPGPLAPRRGLRREGAQRAPRAHLLGSANSNGRDPRGDLRRPRETGPAPDRRLAPGSAHGPRVPDGDRPGREHALVAPVVAREPQGLRAAGEGPHPVGADARGVEQVLGRGPRAAATARRGDRG